MKLRRAYLIYFLVFAVLAAAVALAYYGYSFANEVSSRERAIIFDTTRELAEEKVAGIESQILDSDQKLFDGIRLDPIGDLTDLVTTTGAAVTSVFVLDQQFRVIPGGHYSTRPPESGKAFLDYFRVNIVPSLPLRNLPLSERQHVHGIWGGQPFLFSFQRKMFDGVVYFVVIESDLAHLVGAVFPQTFALHSPRLFQVVDDRGDLVYGVPFVDIAGGIIVELAFAETVDKWRLRVAQKDAGTSEVRGRRRIVDFVLIGLAVAVITAGLAFLALAMRRERRANELKSEFISNVSHELKTPLSIISMFGELLATGRTKNPAQSTEYAEIIWRESLRLSRLIENVLDFSKIERGQGIYEFANGDVASVVQRALELSQRRLAAAQLQVNVNIAADLPEVRMDENAFTLAVLNLIENAVKYAAEGEKLAISLQQQAKRIVLTVRDWGPGIPQAEHLAIFERFYRAKAVRLRPIRGSGIGLALVQHIARGHGGEVSVRNVEPQGAEFTLWIPIITIPEPEASDS